MNREYKQIEGACHCRNIGYVLSWPESEASIPVRICGCTFCQKRNGSWTSHPEAELIANIVDPANVSQYRFGTETAIFYVCSVCGVVPFVTSTIDENLYAVVNVLSFENPDALPLTHLSTNFDAEDLEHRLDRRKRNWIRHVRFQ